jgi:hypothetical protein
VDSARWSGFTLFVGFNDIFFMSLMFFLSGLFVWATYAQSTANPSLGRFWHQWLSLGESPSGPAWVGCRRRQIAVPLPSSD